MSMRRSLYPRERLRGISRQGDRPRVPASVPILVLVSVGLLALSKLEHGLVRELRWQMAELFKPVLEATAKPLEPLRWAGRRAGELLSAAEELERVRAENQELKSWESRARELERRLAELARLSHVVEDKAVDFVTVRVVASSSGAFERSATVNAGEEQLLRVGYPVLSGDGIVGRVVETGRSAARVLLLTDSTSRVPVHVGANAVRAILAGDNGPLPRLLFLPADALVAAGDEVVSSGIGGLYPRGVRIGVVVDGPRGLRVRPYADLDALDYLSVLFFESPELELAGSSQRQPPAAEARALQVEP